MTEDERNYINLLNDAINRMDSNSSNAKSCLVAIVAAFPNLQSAFINHEKKDGQLIADEYKFNIYDIKGKYPKMRAIFSWSTTPFYGFIALCVVSFWLIIRNC